MSEMTLGKTIGTVVDNFEVTNNAGVKVQLRLNYDFSTCADSDIKSWLCGNRRISAQRPMRSLSEAEIKALDGTVINALDCGKKVKSDEEIKAEYKARFNAASDEIKAAMIAELQASMASIEDDEE